MSAELYLYRDERGRIPLADWLVSLPRKARIKCIVRIQRLAEMGHELRRPEADYLDEGIYELRASNSGVQYRMLYFFAGRSVVVRSHGLVKEAAVPRGDIDLAIGRKKQVELGFAEHTTDELENVL